MKTLYKNSRLIAATIVGTFVLSTGAAVAVAKDSANCRPCLNSSAMAQVENVGRFVVTPNTVNFVAPAEVIGRFVVSQHGAVFVPAA